MHLNYTYLVVRSLVNKLNAKEIAGEVIAVTCEMRCFAEPMQTVYELQKEAEKAAMAAGDLHWACLNRMNRSLTMFHAGEKLSEVKDAVSQACRFTQQHNHTTALFFLLPAQRNILCLMGKENEALSENELALRIHGNRNPHQRMTSAFHNLWMSYMMGGIATLKEYAEIFFEFKETPCESYFSCQ